MERRLLRRVDGAEEGCVAVEREDEVLATDPENKVGWAKYVEVDPVPGLMVLFPSWLLHCVLPFEPAAADDHYRISVAFNIGREEEGPEEGAPG